MGEDGKMAGTRKLVNPNRGKAQTKSVPRGTYKATKVAKNDPKGQVKVRAKNSARKLAAENTARRKAGDKSAARTKTQIKKDDATVKKGGKSSINKGYKGKAGSAAGRTAKKVASSKYARAIPSLAKNVVRTAAKTKIGRAIVGLGVLSAAAKPKSPADRVKEARARVKAATKNIKHGRRDKAVKELKRATKAVRKARYKK